MATALLTSVCEDAAAEGYELVEAYPPREFISVFADFMGPYKLYEKLGFTVHRMNPNGSCVVRKYLKKHNSKTIFRKKERSVYYETTL